MRRSASLSAALILLLTGSRARGDDAPPAPIVVLTAYEREAIDKVRKTLGNAPIDESPEGKVIESVEIARFEVLDERDLPGNRRDAVVVNVAESPDVPLPDVFNAIHVVSKDYVIRREMLLKEGDVYRATLVQETARNLRSLAQLSQTNIVALAGSDSNKVRLLVVTKDLWSLRLSYDLTATPGGIESFTFIPQETNIGGQHWGANLRYVYQPLSNTFGFGLRVPRIGWSRIGASAGASVTTNALTGNVEGQGISAGVGQPLFSTRTPWAYNLSGSFTAGVARRYVNAKLAGYKLELPDAATTEEKNAATIIPFQYRSLRSEVSAELTRSYGWATKFNLTGALNYSAQSYRTIDDALYPQPLIDQFVARNIPIGERRVGPSLTASTFRNEFLALTDVQTFALQEDVQLYQSLSATVYPYFDAFGSSRNVFGGSLAAGYTLPIRGGRQSGFIAARVATFAELEATSRARVSDGSYSASLRLVTPKTAFGRLVVAGSFANRYANYLNQRVGLGGDTRLRGYPSNFYTGKDLLIGNVELRSPSFRFLSLQVGGVAFFDIGDTPDGIEKTVLKQSVGAGIRVLIPWLNRVVARGDLGFPLNRTQAACGINGVGCRIDPVSFFFAFDQAI